MRPAGRGQYESLYFDYPQFEVPVGEELRGQGSCHPVVIVGAGPVGLLAALELARHGVRSLVLDDKTTVNDGSRAICLARHSMETLQQLGLQDVFARHALAWTSGRSYFRGKEVYRLEMPHSDAERFLPMYNLQQQYIEKYLVDAAQHSGLVDIRWGHAVNDAHSTADGANLKVECVHGSYAIQSRYCLAADGARSAVRRSLGLALHGEAYESKYVIADIRLASDYPTERRAYFDPPANPGATLLVHKQPDDIWRVDWQLQQGEDDAQALDENNLRRKIAEILDMLGEAGPWELEWWSIYKAFTLCLDDYRHGPFMFIGDAAHLVPIFGVRGLNSGIADAGNVAWKLAEVLDGRAPDALLDTYSPERRGATMEVFENASKSTAFMSPSTAGLALMRDAALSLSLNNEFARPFLNPRQSTPYNYADSTLTSMRDADSLFSAGPNAGAPAVNVRLGVDDFLLDHLGNGFSLLLFCEADEVDIHFKAGLDELRDMHFDVNIIVVARQQSELPGLVVDLHGAVYARYGATVGTAYLVRPDRHVAARWLELIPSHLGDAAAIVLARASA